MIELPPGPFFITGGTMPPNAPSYVVRQADHDLLAGLREGEFCYMLTSRQMGKSSLMVRTAMTLQTEGCAVVVLELTEVGQRVSEEQWYYTLLFYMGQRLYYRGQSLGLEAAFDEYWRKRTSLAPVQRWMGALREVALPALQVEGRNLPRLIICIDEIDAVRSLPFSVDGFFAAIRALYNRRAFEPDLNRLTFCLLGSATPSDLIKDTRLTPFNIGRRIDLADFTTKEAAILAPGLSREEIVGEAMLARILYWTGGHPYLTQRLCSALLERMQEAQESSDNDADHALPPSSLLSPSSEVDRLCEDLFFSSSARTRDSNLLWVRDRMLNSELDRESILLLYDRVRRGRHIRDNEADEQVSVLRLAGIVRPVGGLLAVRNRIYERVFDGAWVQDQLPDAFLRKQRAAYRRQLLSLCSVLAIILCLLVSTFVYRRQAIQSERRAAQYLTRVEQVLYADHMHQIQHDWETNDIGHVLQLLEETRASRLRGFEWDYWNRLCHLDLMTLQGHTREISSVAFSPDGKRIVTASWDHTAKVWDARTGQEILTLQGHTKEVSFAAFSRDGRRIVTGSYDHTAKVWDAATGRELHTVRGCTELIGFSPDSQQVVSRSRLKVSDAEVWDVNSGRRLLTLTENVEKPAFGGKVEAVSFSPNGKRIVTGSDDHTAKVWDARTGRKLLTLKGHTEPVISGAFSPDGRRIVTASWDGTAKVWDARTGQETLTLQGHTKEVSFAAFSPDGKQIVTGIDDRTVKVWDAQTGRETLTISGHTSSVRSAAFSPDGKTIVTASWDKTARVWDAQAREDILTFRGHTHQGNTHFVFATAFSPDSRRIVTGGEDGLAKVWDARTGREMLTLGGHTSSVSSAAFSPDGKTIVTGSWDYTAKVWSAQTGQELLTLKGHTGLVTSAGFSPDGRRIVTGSFDRTAKVWDAQTGKELLTLQGHTARLFSAAFSPDGKKIVTGSFDKTARVWDARTGREIRILMGHTENVSSASFSPDGKRIVTGSWDTTAKVWDAQTGQELLTLGGHTGAVTSAAFSPDGKRIVTGSYDPSAKVWDAQAGQDLLTLKEHTDKVCSVAFSPDGKRIVTGSEDGTAKVWSAQAGNDTH